MPAPRFTLLAALAVWLLAAVAPLRAGEGGFTSTLSQEQQAAAGLTSLAPAERAVLDQLVGEEVALARQQGIGEFSMNFIARRSADELKEAGLDRLTAEQQASLNDLVAAALAARPKPKERPRLKDSDVLAAAKPVEIHGSITLSYGWGGGRTMRAESLWLDFYDPASRISLGIGLSNFDGNGFYGYDPDYYGRYYGSRYSGAAPFVYDASYRGASGNDFAYGRGQSFCSALDGNYSGRGFRRH